MQIEARVVAHSKSSVNGKEIVTFELIYPRIVHSELLTHRLFSRNAASSRAIPMKKVIDMVREHPAMPVRFGANQAGMQDKGIEHTGNVILLQGKGRTALVSGREAWKFAALNAISFAEAFDAAGYHKQIGNRLLEPFQWMKTVLTFTEGDNWFWLRDHTDADPTIAALANCMWVSLEASEPVVLQPGEWHVPYVEIFRDDSGEIMYATKTEDGGLQWLSTEEALAVSSSCCAQVSYRLLDDTLEKAQTIYARLIESEPVHASPFEHQATPMAQPIQKGRKVWEEGVTHVDRNGSFWSGNFKGFIQHRQLIPNNACWNYNKEDK